MKKALLIIMAALLVFAVFVPVALSAPEDFQILEHGSLSTDVIRVQMRLRDLGYLNYRATGNYLGMTVDAVMDFQKYNELPTDGQCGQITYDKLFEWETIMRRPNSPDVLITYGKGLSITPEYGEAADWFDEVDAAFPAGTTVTVTDFNTGETYKMQRTGGVNHAYVESPDADEYDKYIDTFGGVPNWEKRPVLVTVGSKTYAASMFGNAAGEDTIPENTMAGHAHLYFMGSLSEGYGMADKEHFKNVLTASGISDPTQWNQMWMERK